MSCICSVSSSVDLDLVCASVENAATLFRSTSLATTLMDQYMKLTASEFVRAALFRTVQRITDGNLKVEVRSL